MLIDGLSEQEWKTLQTPLKDARGWTELFQLNDRRIAAIRTTNKNFIPAERTGAPAVVSDDLGLQGLRNHADGKLYDSKSQFRNATKRAGCVEIGNEPAKEWKAPLERGIQGDFNVQPALKEALQKHGVK